MSASDQHAPAAARPAAAPTSRLRSEAKKPAAGSSARSRRSARHASHGMMTRCGSSTGAGAMSRDDDQGDRERAGEQPSAAATAKIDERRPAASPRPASRCAARRPARPAQRWRRSMGLSVAAPDGAALMPRRLRCHCRPIARRQRAGIPYTRSSAHACDGRLTRACRRLAGGRTCRGRDRLFFRRVCLYIQRCRIRPAMAINAVVISRSDPGAVPGASTTCPCEHNVHLRARHLMGAN